MLFAHSSSLKDQYIISKHYADARIGKAAEMLQLYGVDEKYAANRAGVCYPRTRLIVVKRLLKYSSPKPLIVTPLLPAWMKRICFLLPETTIPT